jgi:molybdopterin molybdotransferase
MPAHIDPDWLGVREARDAVISRISSLPTERVALQAARGRVLAEELRSPIDLPLWTNSAMDGFAVHAADVRGASRASPVELPVTDDVPAGAFPAGPLARGTCARVMTGAPVPEGADGVVRVEHTDGGEGIGTEGGRVRVFDDADAGRNLRQRGEELRRGDVALSSGTPLRAAEIGVAAALGRAQLSVHRQPVVGVLTSGDELVEVDGFAEVLAGRRIVSANSYALAAQLEEAGCRPVALGIAADTPESLRERLEAARGCDALVTTAGISVGEHDHIKAVLLGMETEVAFWRVRMKPGSPFAFGHVGALGGIPWFGLPGNPVSSMVTFEIFVRPALLRMAGRAAVHPRLIRARLLEDFRATPGLTHFPRVRLGRDGDGEATASLTGSQGSGILSSMAAADGLAVIEEGSGGASAGELVRVIPLNGAWLEERAGF